MCYQVIELYALCRCLYYQHAVDRCAAYGRPGHGIQRRSILVGYSCNEHTLKEKDSDSTTVPGSKTLEPIRQDGHRLTAASGRQNVGTATESSTANWRDMLEASGSIAMALKKRRAAEAQGPANVTSEVEDDALQPFSDDSDDWDADHDSDGESVISAASSTTTVDGDAAGLFFSKLLCYGDLRYLWPQLITRSSTWKRSHRTIERLLRRYSDDLQKLALNATDESVTKAERAMRIQAARFVRRARVNIAQRLCEAHYHASDPRSTDPGHSEMEKQETRQPANDEIDGNSDSDGEGDPLFIYEAAEAFFFRTEPILFLQANVKALVRFRAMDTKSPLNLVWDRVKVMFENSLLKFQRRDPGLGNSTRLHWTCACGKALFDDYSSSQPEKIAELESLLRGYGKDLTVDQSAEVFDVENSPEQSREWKSAISGAFKAFLGLLASTKVSSTLPRHRQDEQQVITTGACTRAGLGNISTHDFLLLCIPFMHYATKVYQPEICRINSDQEFLHLLRRYYTAKRGKSSWRFLRKVKSINFIKFEMYRSHLADVRLCPSVPPPDRVGTEYSFDAGADFDVVPPIGPNLLTHLFEHPEHADLVPTIWNRIPRKLRAELAACPARGSSLGWGLQLAEGMEWFLFFVLGCAGFLACLLIAVVWSILQGDVQGGFSIGGFLLAFLVFCGGIAHTAISE